MRFSRLANPWVSEPVSGISSDATPLDLHLEEIDRCLRGRVGEEERQHLMNETAFWIERQIRDDVLTGVSYDEAAQRAIARHGKPAFLADRMVEEVFEKEFASPLYDRFGRGVCLAAAVFGLGNTIYLVLLQLTVYLPSQRAVVPFSPAEVRSIFPEPLPYPEVSWQFLFTVGYPVLAPFLLGAIAGWGIPVNAARATFHAILGIVLCSFLLGSLLIPNTSGLLYAVFQTVFWLPVGCLAAYLASSIRRKRRQRAWKPLPEAR